MPYPIQKVTLSFLASATGGEIVFGSGDEVIESISTDSRDCNGADLFIAISGEKFDGNKFIPSACAAGVKGYISNGDCECTDCKFALKVADTRKALLDIAAAYRRQFNINIVGLTGSVGKTTTKELISAVLETERNIIKTQGISITKSACRLPCSA